MLRSAAAALLLLVPLSAFGIEDECSADLAALQAFYAVRDAMLQPSPLSYTIDSRIDESLDALRGPLGNGAYEWVRYVRPSGEGPVLKQEHLISSAHDSDEIETFEAEGTHPYAVRVVVPRKRSIFKANKPAWVGGVEIRYWFEGKPKTIQKRIDQWMAPDTSKSFDIGVIADRAEVSVETATKSGDRKESLVEVHFRQAVPQDDTGNPNYETIQTLKKLRDGSSGTDPEVTLDAEIGRLEKRLFPAADSVPLATIVTRLREAEKLMRSEKPEDVESGRKLFLDTMRLLPR
jgi:hypothetical protein